MLEQRIINGEFPSKIGVAVLLIFFTRYEKTLTVFEAIKMARPAKLYLYQDGPRSDKDLENILKCRSIVDLIDWKCELHIFFQEKNKGCDPSEYIAQKWMFETEEMGIILEDDDVPSQSFFPYCKELLEKYKDDTRINMICGMNNNDISKEVKESYFFTKIGSIWGWASWRRVLDTWDPEYSWLSDQDKIEIIRKNYSRYQDFEAFIQTSTRHKESGRAHYESINGAAAYLYNRVNIVPKFNMISNIGIDKESTHSVSDVRLLPKRTQKLLYKKTYEIDFPLVHPENIVINEKFEKKMTVNKFQHFFDRTEGAFRYIRYKGLKAFFRDKVNKKK